LSGLHEVVEGNRERLTRVFSYYCSFGEPLNTNSMPSSKFIKLLKDAKLLPTPSQGPTGAPAPGKAIRDSVGPQSIFSVNEPPYAQPLRGQKENLGSRLSKNPGKSGPFISKVDADLLFTRHTGIAKSKKIPPSASSNAQGQAIPSSFSQLKKTADKKGQLHGLNRMDLGTFILALSDIATKLYMKSNHDISGAANQREEAQALQILIQRNLMALDESIQRTEKGNNAHSQII